MSQQRIDVSELIDERRVCTYNVMIVALSFLVILFDGYDITAMGFAAPYLVKAWQIPGGPALGPVFSASLFGVLFGSPILGFVGDRYGRKVAVVASCLLFGVFTLAAAWATSLDQLMVLRALAGLGLGGLLPNMIALNGEFAPRRFRATMIILMFCGVTAGGALPGAVAVWLVPVFGWQALFYVGGLLPLVMVVGAILWLPESVKFLALRPATRGRAVAVLNRLMPDLKIAPDALLIIPGEHVEGSLSPKMLFSGGLAVITPLLWLCFAINLMGYYFLISWMPTLLTAQKVLSPSHVALAGALIQIGGTLGGLVIARPMDLKGFIPVAFFSTAAVPCVALIGVAAGTSETALLAMMFLAGFCLLGLQFGLNATSAMIYPTQVRSNGSGWAFGVGRFGSIAGPIVGGFLIQMKLPIETLFVIAAIPFAIGAVSAITLTRFYAVQFKGAGLGQRVVQPATS